MKNIIADYESREIQSVVAEILKGKESEEDKLEALFLYVRDSIKFGFLPKIDDYRASEILKAGIGQCNNKSGLFLAMCKASGIEARIHFSGIKKEIQRGLFRGITYKLMPSEISHSWIEVKIDGIWKQVDSYINDSDFYTSGKVQLKRENWKTGYSISCESGSSSSDFDLEGKSFVQMDAVTEDFEVYDDPAEFYHSSLYQNKPGFLKKIIYLLSLPGVNRRVVALRNKSL